MSTILGSLRELRKLADEMYRNRYFTLPPDAIEIWANKLRAGVDDLERQVNKIHEDIRDVDEDFGHSPEDLNIFT